MPYHAVQIHMLITFYRGLFKSSMNPNILYSTFTVIFTFRYRCHFYYIILYSNSSEFKGKLEIGNNSAAEFDTKFINISELFTKSYKNLLAELDFVKSSALFIDLVSNSAAELLPFSIFPLNSEELPYK